MYARNYGALRKALAFDNPKRMRFGGSHCITVQC